MEQHEGDRRRLARKFFRKVHLPLYPWQLLIGEHNARQPSHYIAVLVLPYRFLGLPACCDHRAKGEVTLPKAMRRWVKAKVLRRPRHRCPRLRTTPSGYAAPLSVPKQFAESKIGIFSCCKFHAADCVGNHHSNKVAEATPLMLSCLLVSRERSQHCMQLMCSCQNRASM